MSKNKNNNSNVLAKQLKVALADTKEKLERKGHVNKDDNDGSYSSDDCCYEYLLLKCELLQRGVIISDDETSSDLWNILERAAGKAKIVSSSSTLPIPICMALHAVMGMAAEACLDNNNNNNKSRTQPSSEVRESVLKRCKDVKDDRLSLLVRLTTQDEEQDNSTNASTKTHHANKKNDCWIKIAMEEYMNAATFNPKLPVMYKRAFDISTTTKSSNNNMAYIPLPHLISIAKSKKNDARVLELSIQLLQTYLSNTTTSNNSKSSLLYLETCKIFENHSKPIPKGEQLQLARSIWNEVIATSSSSSNNIVVAELKLSLELQWEKVLVEEIYDSKMITWERHQKEITTSNSTRTLSSSTTMKKTKKLSSNKTNTNNKKMMEKPSKSNILQKLYSSNWKTFFDDIASSSKLLLDQYNSQLANDAANKLLQLLLVVQVDDESQTNAVIVDLLCQQIQRLVEKTRLIDNQISDVDNHGKNDNGWKDLSTIIIPIILQIPCCKTNNNKITQLLKVCAAQAYIIMFWMTLNNDDFKNNNKNSEKNNVVLMKKCHDILLYSFQLVNQEQQQKSTTSTTTVVEKETENNDKFTIATFKNDGNDDENNDYSIIELEHALTCSKCILKIWELNNNDNSSDNKGDETSLKDAKDMDFFISNTTKQLLEKKYCNNNNEKNDRNSTDKSISILLEATYGTSIWQTWLCWHGWWSSNICSSTSLSWPYCNTTQARIIIHILKDVFKQAQLYWKREIMIEEKMWLSILEADAEVRFNSNNAAGNTKGNLDTAKSLYQSVLSTNENNDGLNFCIIQSLHKTYASLGLARIHLHFIQYNVDDDDESSSSSQQQQTYKKNNNNDLCQEYVNSSLNNLFNILKKHNFAEDEKITNKDDSLIVSSPSHYRCYVWSGNHMNRYVTAFTQHQICAGRQIMAELFIKSNQLKKAKTFLQDAVTDSPNDYNSALAFGAFLLRSLLLLLYHSSSASNDEDEEKANKKKSKKNARTHLLKAAKLGGTNKAEPFSLLGIWYEVAGNDTKRAIGCHLKAIQINPTHPISGRAILRLHPYNEVEHICLKAVDICSSENGWAWNAIGNSKIVMIGKNDDVIDEGRNDEAAIACFQQALRCRDIESSRNDTFGVFYKVYSSQEGNEVANHNYTEFLNEVGQTWSNLASCYGRLEKFSASLKAYTAAFEVTHGILPSDVLLSWAEVELKMEFYLEAISKFKYILKYEENTSCRHVATYGLGRGLLALAQEKANEGKYFASLSYLKEGIDEMNHNLNENETDLEKITSFGCILKLIGDLYSFGSELPPYTFLDNVSENDQQETKLDFILNGEGYYTRALDVFKNDSTVFQDAEVRNTVAALAACDVGKNIFCQAKLVAESLHEGSGTKLNTSMIELVKNNQKLQALLEKSADFFRKAIELNDILPESWCGLGCAVVAIDPIVAQHSFCRALQLDKSFPDVWSNLCFLFLEYGATKSFDESIDALTQVADSPLVWIGRALSLENKSFSIGSANVAGVLSRATDAYRAALQTSRHPSALLGLSLTSRRLNYLSEGDKKCISGEVLSSVKCLEAESFVNMSMFLDLTGRSNLGATTIFDIMRLAGNESENHNGKSMQRIVQESLNSIQCAQNKIADIEKNVSNENISFNILPALPEIARENGYLTDILEKISILLAQVAGECVHDSVQPINNRSNNLLGEKNYEDVRKNVQLFPESGSFWLDLLKCLILKLAKTKRPEKRHVLFSVADKAKTLLHNQAYDLLKEDTGEYSQGEAFVCLNPNLMKVEKHSSKINSSLLSDAYGLCSSIELFSAEAINESKKDLNFSAHCDIQRSILLNPENSFSRLNVGSYV